MARLTIYLDDDTEARLKEAARAEGVSLSRWVADLIRRKITTEWPASVIELAGAWADFQTAEELREDVPADVPRKTI